MISYDGVTKQKQSAVESSTTESSNRDTEDDAYVQWVANVDHNQVTLISKQTFHEMSVISASKFQMTKDVPVERLTERRTNSDFVKKGGIPIVQYPEKSHNGLIKSTMQSIKELTLTLCYPSEVQFTLLRHTLGFLEHPTAIGRVSCRIITQGCSNQ